MKPTLVIMAAGMSRRYGGGGTKQIDPIGPNGEIIIDYSVYDAVRAGFGKVICVIKQEMEKTFHEVVGNRLEKMIDLEYVFQRIDDLPDGFTLPEGRTKPWGTAHAVRSCSGTVKTPFAVISADDFYGRTSFQMLYDFLSVERDESLRYQYCMVGFQLKNTLTENGSASRGVCKQEGDKLVEVIERTKIERDGSGGRFFDEESGNWVHLHGDTVVSMSAWGFTPSIFNELDKDFARILNEQKAKGDLDKIEHFLPSVVDDIIKQGKADVTILPSKEKWFGVTYKEDKAVVVDAIRRLVESGVYPTKQL